MRSSSRLRNGAVMAAATTSVNATGNKSSRFQKRVDSTVPRPMPAGMHHIGGEAFTPSSPTEGFEGLTPGAIYNFLNREVMRQSEYDDMLKKRAWLSEAFLANYNLWDYMQPNEMKMVAAKLDEWNKILLSKRGAADHSEGKEGNNDDEPKIVEAKLEPLRPYVFLYGSCLAGTAFRHGDADFALTFPTSSIVGHAVVAASLEIRKANGENVEAEQAAFLRRVQRALEKGTFEHDFTSEPSIAEDFASDGGTYNTPRLNLDGSVLADVTLNGSLFSGKVQQTSTSVSTNSGSVSATNTSPHFTSASVEASPDGSPFTHKQSVAAGCSTNNMADVDVTKKQISITDLRFATKSDFFAVARIIHPQVLTTFYNHIASLASANGIETNQDEIAKAAAAAASEDQPNNCVETETPKKKKSSILSALEDEIPVRGSTSAVAPHLGGSSSKYESASPSSSLSSPSKPKLFLHRIFRARVPIMQFAPPTNLTPEMELVTGTTQPPQKHLHAEGRAHLGGERDSSPSSSLATASSFTSERASRMNTKKTSTAATIEDEDIGNPSSEGLFDLNECDDADFHLIMGSEETNVTKSAGDEKGSGGGEGHVQGKEETIASPSVTPISFAPDPPHHETGSNNNNSSNGSSNHSSESLIDRLLREDVERSSPPQASTSTEMQKAAQTASSQFQRKGPAFAEASAATLGGTKHSTGSSLLDEVLGRGRFASPAGQQQQQHGGGDKDGDALKPNNTWSSSANAAAALPQASAVSGAIDCLFSSAEQSAAIDAEKVTLTTKTFSRFFKTREEALLAEATSSKVSATLLKAAAERAQAKETFMNSIANNDRARKNNVSGRQTTDDGPTLLKPSSIPPLILNYIQSEPVSVNNIVVPHNRSSTGGYVDPYSLQKRDERHLASTPSHKDKKEHMDLSVALEGCRNSLLVREYMRKYPIAIRGATYLLKHWGRRQQILNARRGWLSPYALTIMFIHCMHQHGVIGGLLSTAAGVDQVLSNVAKNIQSNETSLLYSSGLFETANENNSAARGVDVRPMGASPKLEIESVLPPFPHPSAHEDVLFEYQLIPDLMRLFFCYYGGVEDPAGAVLESSHVLTRKSQLRKGHDQPFLKHAPAFDFDHSVVDIRPSPDRYTLRSEWDDALLEQLGIETRATSSSLSTSRTLGGDLNLCLVNSTNAAAPSPTSSSSSDCGPTRRETGEKNKIKNSNLNAVTTNDGYVVHTRFAHLSTQEKEELLKAARRERWHRLGHEAILVRDPYEDHSLGRSVEFFHAEAIREEFRKASDMQFGGLSDAADFLRM